MDTKFRDDFIALWKKHFKNSEPPITFYYSDNDVGAARAVIGMFDPSARPCVSRETLTFAVPMKRFEKMIGYMEESFLITETWTTIKKRLD